MRRFIIIFLYVIALPSFSCELTVRLENYAPESQKNSNNKWSGVDIDLTKVLLTKAQCQFSVVEISWARALVMLADGDIDLMVNVSKTPIREELFYFIGPIRNEVIVLATNESANFSLNQISDITQLNKPIAIQRNAYYGEDIERLLADKQHQQHFIHVTDNKTKLKLLKRGRISGFLEAKRNIINGVTSDEDFEGVWFQPLEFHSTPIYFALSKKSVTPSLKSRVENAFQQLKNQGGLKAVENSHNSKI
ncbi:substrate-binding periplasmic protein [Colwellia asteriadis]